MSLDDISTIRLGDLFTPVAGTIPSGVVTSDVISNTVLTYTNLATYRWDDAALKFNIQGQMLHAKSLEFKHPITGKQMHLEAPLPEYFTEILNRLKQE